MPRNAWPALLVAAILAGTAAAAAGEAGWSGPRSAGQRLYVPIYASIHALEKDLLNLAVTVSIRNTDAARPIRIERLDYFGNAGQPGDVPFARPTLLAPLATAELLIAQSQLSGDSGAKLLLEWRADAPVTPPLVETIMVGARGPLGTAFTSRAVVLEEWR